MHIEIVQEKRITESRDIEIRKLLCLCFPKDTCFFSKSRFWNQVVPEYTVIFQKHSAIIAHVSVIDRDILIGNDKFHVAGIGSVCVHPSCRGKGLLKKLLAKAMKEASEKGYDFGFLFCKIKIKNIYTNLGWRAVIAPDIIRINPCGTEENFQEWENEDMAMYYPLSKNTLPVGVIHLQGINW
ncbi:MAG: GNAT family N-acetyltransferase [Sedimentisphaerales bacterium]|nr:GNAT family N-acetyltransferase [Sedimentisphaerales bacterium]